jgi:hypothetical protein
MVKNTKAGKPASPKEESISVMAVRRGFVTVCVLGTTPLIYHRLAQKAARELLMPSQKKNRNEKETTLKHDPFAEYRDSVHTHSRPETLLCAPSISFKCALRNAAIDLPGSATKAAIGRLAYVEGDYVPVWGVPKLHMAIVRMADMARTPDVRSRACLPTWAAKLTIAFVKPILNEQVVLNLLAGAGIMQGVGDFRTEKGKGNFGSFELVEENDPRFVAIVKQGGRAAQVEAMNNPEPYDGEAAELLGWFTNEAKRREFRTAAESKLDAEIEKISEEIADLEEVGAKVVC